MFIKFPWERAEMPVSIVEYSNILLLIVRGMVVIYTFMFIVIFRKKKKKTEKAFVVMVFIGFHSNNVCIYVSFVFKWKKTMFLTFILVSTTCTRYIYRIPFIYKFACFKKIPFMSKHHIRLCNSVVYKKMYKFHLKFNEILNTSIQL